MTSLWRMVLAWWVKARLVVTFPIGTMDHVPHSCPGGLLPLARPPGPGPPMPCHCEAWPPWPPHVPGHVVIHPRRKSLIDSVMQHPKLSCFWLWIMIMIIFFPTQIYSTFATFRTKSPSGSQFAQIGSHFAQNTTPIPCSLLSRHILLSGICTNTKHPQPHPKTPLFLASGPELESRQNEVI